MIFLSKCLTMSFNDAATAARESLRRHQLSILAEIDMRQALRGALEVDFRPYLILSACSLPLAQRAIEADATIGSILLCNVVVREDGGGRVELSVVDPTCTLGAINNIELISIARELHSLVRNSIDEIELRPGYHSAA